MTAEAPQSAPLDVLDRLGVPMPDPAGDPEEAKATTVLRMSSLARWFLAPTVLVTGVLTPGVGPTFWAILVLQLLWTFSTSPTALARLGRRPPDWLLPGVDLLGLAALIAASGASESPLRLVLVAVPFAAGFLVAPRVAMGIAFGAIGAYLAPAEPDLFAGTMDAPADAVGVIVLIVSGAGAGVAVAVVRERASAQVRAIAAGRRRLLATGMGAEDSERRRVSQQLHGDALQLLLAAAQDLDERTAEGLQRAREGVHAGVAAVRDTVRDLHPITLRHAGLESSLRAALEHRVRQVSGARVIGEVDERRESLLLALIREIGDALAALELDDGVAAQVESDRAGVVLTVSTPTGAAALPELAAALRVCTERVNADNGHLDVAMGPDGRVLITARLGRIDEGVAAPDRAPADGLEHRAELVFGLVRLLAFPGAILVASVSGEPTLAFYVLLALAATYDGATVAALLWLRRWRPPVPWLMSLATLCSAAAITQQGDPTTPLAASVLWLPFLLTMSFTPRALALLSGLVLAVLAVGWVPGVVDGGDEVRAGGAVLLAAYLWAAASSVVMATGRVRLLHRRENLERARRRLLHDGIGAADAERRRLSEALHDGALQELMITAQDIDEAIDGDSEASVTALVALRSGVDQLRDAVTDLHPPALEHGGLRPALTSVVERVCRRTALHHTIDVDPEAPGRYDELIINLVRELATNACKHARSDHLRVWVGFSAGHLQLVVRDDGVGASEARIAAAVDEGHIGLASSRERVEAEGGTLDVLSTPGIGTTVIARFPPSDTKIEAR